MKIAVTIALPGAEPVVRAFDGPLAQVERRVRAIAKRYPTAEVSWREVRDEEATA